MEKMIFDGREFDLIPKTMKVARQIEKTEQSATITEAYRNEYETLKMTIGTEAVAEILGTSNLEEIDLTKMVAVYNAMIDGYDAPLAELERAKEEEILNSPSLKAIRDVATQIKAIQALDDKKNFVSKK